MNHPAALWYWGQGYQRSIQGRIKVLDIIWTQFSGPREVKRLTVVEGYPEIEIEQDVNGCNKINLSDIAVPRVASDPG
ncbi:hypothetical protein NPIL_378681 [Nephila pilipes]|uniref:Uncharacterized protein n=1 Tax=Nephila pilipes TaxID=299642 RepID=A0A8X6UQG6_NEPPI|nr:hypothetical protein NPIL_378681 [Nephila pilipes]